MYILNISQAIFVNGREIAFRQHKTLGTKNEFHNVNIACKSFDDLLDMFERYWKYGFDIKSRRKGRVVQLRTFNFKDLHDSKYYFYEWRRLPEIVFVRNVRVGSESLDWIFKQDADMAIRYLKERGLTMCPMTR